MTIPGDPGLFSTGLYGSVLLLNCVLVIVGWRAIRPDQTGRAAAAVAIWVVLTGLAVALG